MTLPMSDMTKTETKSKKAPQANVFYSPLVSLEEIVKRYIIEALDFHNNNKFKAAKYLGITVRTLHNKLRMYGLDEVYRKRPKQLPLIK